MTRFVAPSPSPMATSRDAASATRARTMPLATLLLLVSVIVGTGGAVAGVRHLGDRADRIGRDRQNAIVVVSRAANQHGLAAYDPASDKPSFVPPAGPRIAIEALNSRPQAGAPTTAPFPDLHARTITYRARAPPANRTARIAAHSVLILRIMQAPSHWRKSCQLQPIASRASIVIWMTPSHRR